jgi:nucleotide-binding universal stress UspA family protein
MTSLGRIDVVLVPLDGSEFSARAVPIAARLATRLQAKLLFFSAVPKEDERRARKAQLIALQPRDHAHAPWVVVNKDPAGAIHEALHELRFAIACIASHGRNRSAAFGGSVTTEIVARGHDSLVLVGPLVDATTDGKGVVACIDETPASAAAILPTAALVADLLDEPLTVITVAEPAPVPLNAPAVKRRFGPSEDVDVFLDRAIAPLRRQGHAAEARAVYDPISPAAGVRDYVWQHPASLVAVASHARTGAKRLLLGSVAAEIVRTIVSPVLVVPRPDA